MSGNVILCSNYVVGSCLVRNANTLNGVDLLFFKTETSQCNDSNCILNHLQSREAVHTRIWFYKEAI